MNGLAFIVLLIAMSIQKCKSYSKVQISCFGINLDLAVNKVSL